MDGVVLLHGIFRTHRSMRGLAQFLEEQGYRTLNLGYPSTRYSLEELVEIIHPVIERFAKTMDGDLHFIGYSMGGLLVRAYLHKYRPAFLGRVVLIGTPNSGSEVADFLKDFYLYKKLYGPAGQQLITDQTMLKPIMGEITYEAGAIAANRSIDPISSYIIGEPNDGKVSVKSTWLPQLKDHTVVATNHTFLPMHKPMWAQTLNFLQNGRFTRLCTS